VIAFLRLLHLREIEGRVTRLGRALDGLRFMDRRKLIRYPFAVSYGSGLVIEGNLEGGYSPSAKPTLVAWRAALASPSRSQRLRWPADLAQPLRDCVRLDMITKD
jgi:hypothetical protein